MLEADWLVIRRTLKRNWAQIADDLDISERHLRRYRKGESEVPVMVQLALEGLLCRALHQDKPAKDERRDLSAAMLIKRLR